MNPPSAPKKGFPVWAIILIVIAGLFVVFIGVLAALGIYGTRRYISAAKTAEAKSTVGAIARAAQAAYDRESIDDLADSATKHELCGSAQPVPGFVPMAAKYMPSTAPGSDFETGDAKNGWKCLKFSMSTPIYYQYHYNKGKGYIAPSASPGPKGFEAAAQGDVNGDGVKSTFARTGTIGADGALQVSTSLYIENEFE